LLTTRILVFPVFTPLSPQKVYEWLHRSFHSASYFPSLIFFSATRPIVIIGNWREDFHTFRTCTCLPSQTSLAWPLLLRCPGHFKEISGLVAHETFVAHLFASGIPATKTHKSYLSSIQSCRHTISQSAKTLTLPQSRTSQTLCLSKG
jgi:hypothetical protein